MAKRKRKANATNSVAAAPLLQVNHLDERAGQSTAIEASSSTATSTTASDRKRDRDTDDQHTSTERGKISSHVLTTAITKQKGGNNKRGKKPRKRYGKKSDVEKSHNVAESIRVADDTHPRIEDPPEPFNMKVPRVTDHSLQFLVRYATMMSDGLISVNQYLQTTPDLLDIYKRTELDRVRAEVCAVNTKESRWTKRSFIRKFLPHAPRFVVLHMLQPGSPLYYKFKAAISKHGVRPDFTVLQLLCLAFWAEGLVATVSQLKAAILRMFPYFGHSQDSDASTLHQFTSPEWLDFVRGDPQDAPENIGAIIDCIITLNSSSHERLFDIIDAHDRSFKLRLDTAFIAQIFEGHDIVQPSTTFTRFLDLPTELRLIVWEKSLHLEGKVLTLSAWRHSPREPFLEYEEVSSHSEVYVTLPPYKKLMASRAVNPESANEVLRIFFKQPAFVLDMRPGSVAWLRSMRPGRQAMFRKVILQMNMNGNAPWFVDIARRFVDIVLSSMPNLQVLKVVFDHRRQSLNQVHQSLSNFRQNSAIIALSRYRCKQAKLDVIFYPRVLRLEEGRMLFKDNLQWLENLMKA